MLGDTPEPLDPNRKRSLPLPARLWSEFSLRGKIVLPFLAVTVLTALVGTFVVTRLMAGSAHERFDNQLYESSRLASAAVVDQESNHLSVLRLMVFTEGLPGALETRDVAGIDGLLRPLAGNAGIELWAVLDREGGAVLTNVATPTSSAGDYDIVVAEWRDDAAIQRVLAGAQDDLGDKMVGITTVAGEPYFFTAAPIAQDDGRVLGVAVVGTRLSTLLDLLRERSNAQQVMLTREGAFRASTMTVDPWLLVLTPDEAASVDRSPSRPVEIAGVGYEALYTPLIIRQQPVGVLVTLLPTDFVVSAEAISRNAIAAVFLVLVAATTALGLGLAYLISAPIRRLQAVTQKVADGDLDQATGIDSVDEIGMLARAFDRMTEMLRRRTAQSESLQIATRELYEQALQRGEQLAAANQQLAAAQAHMIQREKIALMGRVASHIAQDVRAPLTAALTLIDLLDIDQEIGPEGRQQLEQIRSNTERAGRMLGELDRFAHPTENERMLVDLRLTTRAVLEGQTASLVAASVTGSVDLPAEAVYATIDPGRIQQALGALLAHRLLAIPAGGTLTLRLVPDAQPGLVCVVLSDDGSVISAAEAARLFDPDFDVNAEALTRQLSLAVSYGLIAEHGGRIDVHSDPDTRDRFSVWLPLNTDQDVTIDVTTTVHLQVPAILERGRDRS